MHRFYQADVSATPPPRPAGGQRGYPTATPVPTIPGPYWHHMVTEEIISAIVAGGLQLDDENVGQLGQVISAIIQSVNSNAQLLTTMSGTTMPYGALIPWPGPTPPEGFIKANGSLMDRSGPASYPKLTQAILSGRLQVVTEANWPNNPGAYTLGDGATTIRVPDVRGLVLKGHHDGSSTRTTNITRLLGSYEGDEIKSHSHSMNAQALALIGGVGFDGGGLYGGSVGTSSNLVNPTGGLENTVRNISVLWCIRAYD